MLKNFWEWFIENIDIKTLKQSDIIKMYEIERDTWSHFMGEYVRCDVCDINYSKQDIYSKIDPHYDNKTVWELEKQYWRSNIKCSCCFWDVKDMRWEDFIPTLESRIFSTKKWFVNFYKSKIDKLLGFSYWFIDSPENTYQKEFSFHFNEKLLSIFQDNFWDEDLLTLSWVCITQKSKNILAVYELIKNFYCSIEDDYDELIWIWEAIVWTPTYRIYKRMLPYSFCFKKSSDSEVLYQYSAVSKAKKYKNNNIGEFLKISKFHK